MWKGYKSMSDELKYDLIRIIVMIALFGIGVGVFK